MRLEAFFSVNRKHNVLTSVVNRSDDLLTTERTERNRIVRGVEEPPDLVVRPTPAPVQPSTAALRPRTLAGSHYERARLLS